MKLKKSTEIINEDTIKRKINALRDEKLKIALRLQLKSGLRVSEIANLTKDDVIFEENKIMLHVKNGKGSKSRTVHVIEDEYLFKKLKDYIGNCIHEKLFWSQNYLRHKAKVYDIETHDLRRINSQERFNQLIEAGKKKIQAKHEVKEELGHENLKFTNIYLNRKKILGKPRGNQKNEY